MGSLHGHVLPGIGFIVMAIWQLFNQTKLHSLCPDSYYSHLWFPTSKIRYLELYIIMLGSFTSMWMELFVGPAKHHPFDKDGTIPTNHLHNFEHFFMSGSMFSYAIIAIFLDKTNPRTKKHGQTLTGLAQLVAAVFFAQELLLFHFHSTDHKGLESQYHILFELLICISLSTTLIGIYRPKSFLISFVRSLSVFFQGIWLIVTGVMLWTPCLSPKGCFVHKEDGHYVMRCHSDAALHRAKALVNIQFSFYVIVVTAFSVTFYLAMDKAYGKKTTENHYSLSSLKEVELSKDDVKSLRDMGKGIEV